MRTICTRLRNGVVIHLLAAACAVGADGNQASRPEPKGQRDVAQTPDAPLNSNSAPQQAPLLPPATPPTGPDVPAAALPDQGPLPGTDVERVAPLLSLSLEQRQKLQDLVQSVRNDIQVLLAGAQQFSREKQGVSPSDLKDRVDRVIQSYRRKLDDILTPAQNQRLREVSLQIRGTAAIHDPDVASALNLSAEQRASIAAIIDEVNVQQRGITQAPRPLNRFERQDRRQARRQLRQQLDARLISVLTPEQRDEFARMQGPRLGLNDLLQLQTIPAGTPSAVPSEPDEPKVELGEPKR